MPRLPDSDTSPPNCSPTCPWYRASVSAIAARFLPNRLVASNCASRILLALTSEGRTTAETAELNAAAAAAYVEELSLEQKQPSQVAIEKHRDGLEGGCDPGNLLIFSPERDWNLTNSLYKRQTPVLASSTHQVQPANKRNTHQVQPANKRKRPPLNPGAATPSGGRPNRSPTRLEVTGSMSTVPGPARRRDLLDDICPRGQELYPRP